MAKKSSASNLEHIRHSLAHLLAAAVLRKFPKVKLGIGPVIEDGFYYDFLLHGNEKFSPDDLREFEKAIRDFIRDDLNFIGKKVSAAEAKKLFAGQPFKLELIKDFVKEKQNLTTYRTGDIFTDLCRGGHVKNTKEINPDAFKLTKIAGAYWRGDEKNSQLQRIYGVAFATKKELGEYLAMLEEARKRDHKVLGPDLDLFTFSELVGSGLPLWTPKGTILRDLLDNFVWELRARRGYERVDIPHITKKELYVRSGHWEKFKNELFKIVTREGHLLAIKPMNCPHHTQIYARRKWSYRELPQRYASTTKVYRDEQTGELAGLARVRSITQDDAHSFCRKSQIAGEMSSIWDIVEEFYAGCGFPNLEVRLSFHDPKQPKKYLGSPAVWKKAEAELAALAQSRLGPAFERKVKVDMGEAAFYGPKIDFIAKDSLGRNLQVATIQLDMNMPERFRLACVNEKGKDEGIFMIHAAIMGSIERFLAAFIEHTGGKFPVWLSPVQAEIINVGSGQRKYAEKIFKGLKTASVRARLSDENLTVGKRIREAELQKIPYVLVVGEKEEAAGTVNVRHYRRGQEGEIKFEAFIQKVMDEITRKTV
ncbi:MAG: threonine--tRNA ligase [Candidatus Liptonbacteria bacterium]|nr:threonine--tRNA ligase [Candidatus Liptonbacteria bacterium]